MATQCFQCCKRLFRKFTRTRHVVLFLLTCSAIVLYAGFRSFESRSRGLEKPWKNVSGRRGQVTILPRAPASASFSAAAAGQEENVAARRLPGCLIIGVCKAGTRALLEYINLHPDVVRASQEVHFFDYDSNYERGCGWYKSKMPLSLPNQTTVEKTAMYFVVGKVPERVQRMSSAVKLLLIVREPVTRAISDYTHMWLTNVAAGKAYPTFEQLALDKTTGAVNPRFYAVNRSTYHWHLASWLRYFNMTSQIHVVDGDRLVTDPAGQMSEVERFMGLRSLIKSSSFYFSKKRGFYCTRKTDRVVCLPRTKGRRHPKVNQTVLEKLKSYFAPKNELFFEQVGRNFSW